MKRWLFRTLAVFVVLAAGLVTLGMTETGTRWLIAGLLAVLPGEVSAGRISGRIGEVVVVDDLRYSSAAAAVELERLEFALAGSKLFTRKLHFHEIELNGLRVLARGGGPRSAPLLPVRLPVRLDIERLALERASLVTGSGARYGLRALRAKIQAGPGSVRLDDFHVAAEQGRANGEIELPLREDGRVRGRLDFALEAGARPPLQGSARLEGRPAALRIMLELAPPYDARMLAKLSNVLARPAWQFELDVRALALDAIDARWPALTVSGGISADGDRAETTLAAELRAAGEGLPTWDLQADLGILDLARLEVRSLDFFDAGRDARLRVGGTLALGGPDEPFDLHGQWQRLVWPLAGDPEWRSERGRFQVAGRRTAYRLTARTDLSYRDQAVPDLDVVLHGDAKQLSVERLHAALLDGEAEVSGSLGLEGPLTFDLEAALAGLRWPAGAGAQAFQLVQGRVLAAGRVDDYRLNANAELRNPRGQAGTLRLGAAGTRGRVKVDTARFEAGNARVNAGAEITLQPAFNLTADLSGEHIDPAWFVPGWPGELQASLTISGGERGGLADYTLSLDRLSGTLRDYPFRATAVMHKKANAVRVDKIDVESGRSRLALAGVVQDGLALSWEVHSPALAELWPEASGHLDASGRIGGSLAALRLEGLASGGDVRMGNAALDELDARFLIDFGAAQTVAARVQATGIRFGRSTLDALQLVGRGTPGQHELELNFRGPAASGELAAAGAYAGKNWRLAFEHGRISSTAAGDWELAPGAELKLNSRRLRQKRSCWRDGAAKLCWDGHLEFAGGGWQLATEVRRVPLQLVMAMTEVADGTGDLSGRLQIRGAGSTLDGAEGALRLGAGKLQLLPNTKTPLALAHAGGILNVNLNEKSAEADLEFTIKEKGAAPLRAQLKLPPLPLDVEQAGQLPVSGILEFGLSRFDWVSALVPDLDRVAGRLDVDLELAGTVAAPRLSGLAAFSQGSATVPALGLSITDADLRAEGDLAGGLAISGGARSGDNRLELRGKLSLEQLAKPQLTLALNGREIEAVHLPEAWVLASPDLEVALNDRALRITGEVFVPQAHIEPRISAASVEVSPDAVILENGEAAPEARRQLPLTARVKLRLGEDVRLRVAGFDGLLRGEVLAVAAPEHVTRGTGEITIEQGHFAAYGQKLDIKEGRLLFAGGPLAEPGVDLRATRSVGSVTAGVHVHGRLRDPELSLYSSPAMDDQETLSYLVLGRSLKGASATDAQSLMLAATALGVNGGEMLSQRIGKSFGLDEVTLEGDPGTEMSLGIGKYVTPRLYVGYGLGLIEHSNTVKTRYEINDHWSVEAETGVESGADVLYSIER